MLKHSTAETTMQLKNIVSENPFLLKPQLTIVDKDTIHDKQLTNETINISDIGFVFNNNLESTLISKLDRMQENSENNMKENCHQILHLEQSISRIEQKFDNRFDEFGKKISNLENTHQKQLEQLEQKLNAVMSLPQSKFLK
jgi:peptidoglycan hydrolase CwlO-like protein